MSNRRLHLTTTAIFLFIFIILGLTLRLLYVDRITFFYDQARDAFESINIIAQHHPKLLGPSTDIPGLFHGPLYWYLLSPFYFLSHGNAIVARIVLIVLSLCNIPLIYYFAKQLFRNRTIALLSAFFITISFETVQYARWLSNPSPAVLTLGIFFFGLWTFMNRKSWGLPLFLLGWGLSIQFQFFLVYELVVMVVAMVVVFLQKKKKNLFVLNKLNITLFVLFLLSISTFVISELKFRFQGLRALINFLSEKKGSAPDYMAIFQKFAGSLASNIKFNFIDNQIIAWLVLLGICVYVMHAFYKKSAYRYQVLFLFLWFISPIILYIIEGTNAYFLNIGNVYPLILLASLILYEFLIKDTSKVAKFVFILIIAVISFNNLFLVVTNDKHGETLFAIQQDMLYPYQHQVLDWIYKESNGRPFAIDTVTNPLFIDSTWAFQFNYYGKPKYGYMPMWLGYPQQDYPGGSVQYGNIPDRHNQLLFLIIEPKEGIPLSYISGYEGFENIRSRLIKSKTIHNFTIEERQLTSNMGFDRDTLFQLITNKK